MTDLYRAVVNLTNALAEIQARADQGLIEVPTAGEYARAGKQIVEAASVLTTLAKREAEELLSQQDKNKIIISDVLFKRMPATEATTLDTKHVRTLHPEAIYPEYYRKSIRKGSISITVVE